MPSPAYRLLEYVFLALLYLFFVRVVRAVWVELREPRLVPAQPTGAEPTSTVPAARRGPAAQPGSETASKSQRKRGLPTRLAIVSDGPEKGSVFSLGDELTVGRAAGCAVALPDDTFVSQLHARVYFKGEGYWVEDLGSTNGTLVNGRLLSGSQPLRKGDRVQVGRTVLELQK